MLLSWDRFNATRPATRKTAGHMLHNMFNNAGKGHLRKVFNRWWSLLLQTWITLITSANLTRLRRFELDFKWVDLITTGGKRHGRRRGEATVRTGGLTLLLFSRPKRREVFNLLIVRPSVEKRRRSFLNLGPNQFNINEKIIKLNWNKHFEKVRTQIKSDPKQTKKQRN